MLRLTRQTLLQLNLTWHNDMQIFPNSWTEARHKEPDDHIVFSEGPLRPFPELASIWKLCDLVERMMTTLMTTNSSVWFHLHSGLCGTFFPLCLSCQIASDMNECCLCGASVAMRTKYRTRYGIPVSHPRIYWGVVAQTPKGFSLVLLDLHNCPPHLHGLT